MASSFGTPSVWASQAALNALLRFQPEREGLKDLKRAAEEQFASSVAAGRSEGALATQAAEAARAPTRQIYATAKAEGERGRSLAAPVLAALSASSPFAAAAVNEQSAGTERLAASEAHALSDLQQEGVAATELPAFTRSAALATLLRELGKLQQKGSALEGLEGADKAAEVGKLRAEANRLGVAERGQDLSRQSSREGHETAERDARLAHPTGPGGVKPLTAHEQNEGLATIEQVRHFGGLIKQKGASRSEVVALLAQGIPGESKSESYKDAQGRSHSTDSKSAAIPAIKPSVLVSAGLDALEYGHVTKATQRRLEKAGYDVGKLGIPLETPANAATGAAKNVGEGVKKALAGLG